MSNRKITADEAKQIIKKSPPGPWKHVGHGYIQSDSGQHLNGLNDLDGAILPDCADLAAAAPDLANAVIEQAEQIKRLQQAVSRIMTDLTEADAAIVNEYGTPSVWEAPRIEEYGLTHEDMEEQ